MADSLSLLFELDVDGRPAAAGLQRFRKDIAATIEATRRAITQPFKIPALTVPTAVTSRTSRGSQVDQHVRDFKRIEAEQKKSSAAQEREQRRLNSAVQSLQRQRSAALIRAFRDEERAAVASARAQERAAQQASRAIADAFRGIGSNLQSLGRTLTVGVTAPLLALGVASLKSAKDLDANVNTLKAFTGSAEAAERRLAQLIKTARDTPGLTTNLALTLDAQLRVAKTTEEAIDRVLPAIGRLNAVSKLPDAARFTQNLLQLVTQGFERQDLKELVGQSPLAGQLLTEMFNVDSPTNAKAIREQAKKLGLTTVDTFFKAFAEAAQRNQGLATVTESIGTRFDKLVDRVTVALRPLGLSILKAIEPFIEPVAKLIERIGIAFDSLSEPVKTAIIVIAGIAAAAGPVLFVLGGVATAITSVVAAIGTIGAAVVAVGLPGIAAAVAGLLILIGEWVVILGALGLAWKNNFLGIRELVSDAATAVVGAFNAIRVVIDEATQRVLPTLQSITEKVLGVITSLWERFGGVIVSVVSTSFNLAIRGIEAFLRFFGNLIDLVAKLIDGDWRGAWSAFSRIILNALDGVSEFFNKALPVIRQGFIAIHAFLIRQAITLAQTAETLASRFVVSLVTGFIAGAPQIRNALALMLITAVSGIALGPIAQVLVTRLVAEMRKAVAEGITVPVKATVGVDVGSGEGIRRKKTPPPSTIDTEDTKAADAAARRRIRILELEAEKVRTITDAQLAQEQIAFDERRRSLEEFTNAQIEAAGDVLLAQLAVYAKEREEAKKIRNQSARDLALAEIGQREFEAQQAFTTKVAQLEAARRKEELEAAKAHRQALLDIEDEGDQKQLELIDSYVEKYLISFEEAEKRRIKIEEDARKRRRDELEIQLGEAGQNVEEQQRIKNAIAKLDAEAATAREEAENRKRRALRATLEAEQDYYNTLREISLKTAQLIRDAADIALSGLVRKLGDRRRFRLEALANEREANEAEHQERLRQIEQEKKDAEKRLEGVRDAEEKLLELRRKFAEREKAENERRTRERSDEEQREAEERDPFGPLRERFERFRFAIQNTNDSIAESVGSLAKRVSESISAMGDALRQGIVGWILYGDSIGKAFKAALAQQAASLAAEFALQALKHALYAAGSLAFGNFVGAAKHAAVAAAFAAAAAGLGFAGRALSKSSGLFDRGRSSGAASTAVGGGEPNNRNFNFGGSIPVESSSRAAQDGSGGGGVLGKLVTRIEDLQVQTLDLQKQQQLQSAQIAEALTRMKTARPGDVVTMGAGDARQAIGVAVIDHSNSSGDFNEALQRNLGFA